MYDNQRYLDRDNKKKLLFMPKYFIDIKYNAKIVARIDDGIVKMDKVAIMLFWQKSRLEEIFSQRIQSSISTMT